MTKILDASSSTSATELINQVRALANPINVEGMKRFGICPKTELLGISVVTLRQMAKPYKKNHALAEQLWDSGIHEARIIATVIADPRKVSEAQMEQWVQSFDSWDLCDQCCSNLFVKTPFAHAKVIEWSGRDEEFVKRAGFVLMAALATHDKKADDSRFLKFLPIIEREAADERNFVKKAVNWALRGIGKRNLTLHRQAVETAARLKESTSKAARWTGSDAYRELTSEAVQNRLAIANKKGK